MTSDQDRPRESPGRVPGLRLNSAVGLSPAPDQALGLESPNACAPGVGFSEHRIGYPPRSISPDERVKLIVAILGKSDESGLFLQKGIL